jgi:hypothetical protein
MSKSDHRTKPATDITSRIMSSRDHRQALRSSIRRTLALKYVVLLLLLTMAATFATFDIKAGTFSFTSAKSDLLSGVIASILVALIYDLFTKKQEEVIQEIDRSSLIDDMSREVFLSRGAANLSKEDLLEITKVFLADNRFLETLAQITSRETRYTENILHSYLIPMWRSPIAHFYAWKPTSPSGQTGTSISGKDQSSSSKTASAFVGT